MSATSTTKVSALTSQLDAAFNRPSAATLRQLRTTNVPSGVTSGASANPVIAQQAQNRECRVVGGATTAMHTGGNLLAKDRRVAIAVEGEKNGLVHFDVGQAFAWEYLRKKRTVTRADLEFAQKLQQQEEERLIREEIARKNALLRKTMGDHDFARKLADQMASSHSGTNPQQSKAHLLVSPVPSPDVPTYPRQLLRDSQIARAVASGRELDEVLAEAALLNESAKPPVVAAVKTVPTNTSAQTDALTDEELAKLLASGQFDSPKSSERHQAQTIRRALVSGKSLTDIQRAKQQKSKIWGMVENFRCFSAESFQGKFAGIFPNGNKIALPPSVLEKIEYDVNSKQDQLLLELVNPNAIERQRYVSAVQFTSTEGIAVLPKIIMSSILLDEGDVAQFTRVQMPTCTSISVRVNGSKDEAKQLNSDAGKAALSMMITNRIDALSIGDVIPFSIPAGEEIELVVDTIAPESPAAIFSVPKLEIVQTKDSQRVHQTITTLDSPIEACHVAANEYAYFVFDASQNLAQSSILIEAEALSGDPDLYVSQSEPFPTTTDFDWSSTSTGGDEVVIEVNDAKRKVPGKIYIAVRAFEVDTVFDVCISTIEPKQAAGTSNMVVAPPGSVLCWNCQKPVPQHHWIRHEAFCLRNNFYCALCSITLRMQDKANHWHCPEPQCRQLADPSMHLHCGKCGKPSSKSEIAKHVKIAHAMIKCGCGKFEGELETLLLHKQFECQSRSVDCEFCGGQFAKDQDITKHKQECAQQPVECSDCGKTLKLNQMPSHRCSSSSSSGGGTSSSGGGMSSSSGGTSSSSGGTSSSNNLNLGGSWRTLSLYLCPGCQTPTPGGMDALEDHMKTCSHLQ